MPTEPDIHSLVNPRVKEVVRLRRRPHRDKSDRLLVEGYREILRALDNEYRPETLFHCRDFFLGTHEDALIQKAAAAGARIRSCSRAVFAKMSYRDRPDGLLAVGPGLRRTLDSLELSPNALVLVTERIEKPGNLGTLLRSADAAGAEAVIVCDRGTDILNPNVVRASIGALFAVPTVEANRAETREFLGARGFAIFAASPHAEALYSDCDLTGPTALVVGSEQYGLSDVWMGPECRKVRIPMLGQCDSLNVAAAGTLLLFESVRQRGKASAPPAD